MRLSEKYKFDWRRIQTEDAYHIEYCITDICNRNCIACSHLAPLAKQPNYVSVEDFSKNACIMKNLVPDAHTFWLTGGEPTLHPEFLRLLQIARETFMDNYVGIYSNGITLKDYEDDTCFWDFIRENGIVWAVTNYDLEPAYFENLFLRHDCLNNLAIIQSGRTFASLTNYTQTPQLVTKEKYVKCGWERSKINIRNGMIYNCPSSEFADLFNAYFGTNLQVTADDYLIIDENLTRVQIENFRKEMPFCSQCDLTKRYKQLYKNGPSQRDISEWSSFN